MEKDTNRSSSDLGLSQSFGFQDFEFQDNNIWCEQCKKLKQEIKKLQEEQALNYSTLKKKIISTDLLIKKYKGKCDDYDNQTKRYEEFFRKHEELQRESETLTTQLGSALQQLEPLRKAKLILESDNKQRVEEVEAMRHKVAGLELALRQHEVINRESDTYKDRFEALKRENQRKLHNLENLNQKNEGVINKLKDENRNLRSESSKMTNKKRKMEEKMKRMVNTIQRYWGLLRNYGLLPKGEKKPAFDKYLEGGGDYSTSQEDDEDPGHVSEMESSDDETKKEESITFPWIFSPVVSALSPLPPSPMPCRANKPLMTHAESDEENIDEMANILESELLKSSPVSQTTPKSQSLLRKVQTRSPLVECKQKLSISPKKDTNSNKAMLLKSKSFTTICPSRESLSDSDEEKSCNSLKKPEPVMEKDLNKERNEINLGQVAADKTVEKQMTNNAENKIDHSENSVFRKFKSISDGISNNLSKDSIISKEKPFSNDINNIEKQSSTVVCHELFPPDNEQDNVERKTDSLTAVANITSAKIDQPSNTARKIVFSEKSWTSTNSKESIKDKDKILNKKSKDEVIIPVHKVDEKGDNVKTEKKDVHKNIGDTDQTCVTKTTNDKKSAGNGFDLDECDYDENDEVIMNDFFPEESCNTPNVDVMLAFNRSDETISQTKNDEKRKMTTIRSHTENAHAGQCDSMKPKTLNKEANLEKSGQNQTENVVSSIIKTKAVSQIKNSEKTINILVEKPVSVFRQVSSGFLFKSPSIEKNSIHLPAEFSPFGEKKEILQDPQCSKKTQLSAKKTDSIQSISAEKNVTNSEMLSKQSNKMSQQGSLGFSVDNEEHHVSQNLEQDTIKESKDLERIEDRNLKKQENDLLKEKYLQYVKERCTGKNSNESAISNLGQKMCVEKPNITKDNCLQKSSNDNHSEHHQVIPLMEQSHVSKSKQKTKEKTTTKSVDSVGGSSHRIIPPHKKTLHQLVFHTFDSKSIPSSAVVSPEMPDLTKEKEKRSSSRSSSHSPAPLSPLSVSPFDFSVPMLISPLPPSPVPQREPVSPLPGSPWVEDEVLNTKEDRKTPIMDKVPKKRSKGRPCSFSSSVPTHAISVKPITVSKAASSCAKLLDPVPKPVDTAPKPVPRKANAAPKPSPAERDPLSMGKKQRISRVPKHELPQKRKSLDPVNVEVQEKKKCVEEKGTASVYDKPLDKLKPDTCDWKNVDMSLQQYICLYNMTPETVKEKISFDKDPVSVLPSVILWITQYLRNSEEDMLNKIYKFCKTDSDTCPGPFMTTQESRLVDLCVYIIQTNVWADFRTKLLDSLWNSVMLKEVVTILGRTALCRVFTALCQKEGNIDYVRVLYFHIIAKGYPKFITIGLSIIGVWPQVLYKSDTASSVLMETFEFCIMKVLLNDKEKHEKVLVCFNKLCNWTKPKKMDSSDMLRDLLKDLQATTRRDEVDSKVSDKQFELYRSLELLLTTEEVIFFKATFTQLCLNQLYQKVKANSLMNGGYPVMYFKNVFGVYASILARKIDYKFSLKNIHRFMSGMLKLTNVSMEVQEVIVNSMLDIAFIAPMPVFAQLTEWYQKETKNISNGMKQRLESVRKALVPYEGKLTTFSFIL